MKILRAVLGLIRMNQRVAGKLCLTSICLTSALAILLGGRSFAQSAIQANGVDITAAADEATDFSAPDIIFSNLVRTPGDRFNTDSFFAKPIAGKQASDQTEELYAIRFTPQTDVQAKVLEAAISYLGGDKLVKLGLYSNDDLFQTPKDPLPGGTGSTTRIPEGDECCNLARVTLDGDGITLTGGTAYWLLAAADDKNGASFSGLWRISHIGESAQAGPPPPWDPQTSDWPAAQIRGTKLGTSESANAVIPAAVSTEAAAAGQRVTIFSNLDHTGSSLYLLGPGLGLLVSGPDSQVGEVWEALPFTPRVNAHATTLAAAIGYGAGTKEINLGLFGDNGGLPGTPLLNGQGSTRRIPYYTDCCQLPIVMLPNGGAALASNTQYWLVASPSAQAPDFEGYWRFSTRAYGAHDEPEHLTGWTAFTGDWLAAEIRGTTP